MSVVQFYPLPCVVSLVVKASVCETEEMSSILLLGSRSGGRVVECRGLQILYRRGFESHPELSFQNRLTGRSPPFEGVRLGSNPSSGTISV